MPRTADSGAAMVVDYDVAMEIASHEAIIRQAYKDSVGVWTWSVGLTSASGHDVTRYIGKPQPLRHCLAVYVWALEKYADDVREAFSGHSLSKAQFAGALSFHWNTGAIKRATWVRKWKAGDVRGARKAFMDWRKPREIVPRRRRECALFFAGQWHGDGKMTEFTRLTRRSTPDWSSARRIDVAHELRAILLASVTSRAGTPAAGADPQVAHERPRATGASGLVALVWRFLGKFLKKKD